MVCSVRQIGFFNEMLDRGVVPNDVTYPILIHSLCKRGMVEDALHIFHRLQEKGVRLTVYPYISLINDCYKTGGFGHGRRAFWGRWLR
ncbi:hypothetical protein ACQJBY_073075 [Aegilops geniculata]